MSSGRPSARGRDRLPVRPVHLPVWTAGSPRRSPSPSPATGPQVPHPPGRRRSTRSSRLDGLSPGKRAAAEARGDIWTLPAEKGTAPQPHPHQQLRRAQPLLEPRRPLDRVFLRQHGEYELYITQSDGLGRTIQLTKPGDASTMFRYNPAWSPDSKRIVFVNRSGVVYLYTFGETVGAGGFKEGSAKQIDAESLGATCPIQSGPPIPSGSRTCCKMKGRSSTPCGSTTSSRAPSTASPAVCSTILRRPSTARASGCSSPPSGRSTRPTRTSTPASSTATASSSSRSPSRPTR
jgi:hypothetical protein